MRCVLRCNVHGSPWRGRGSHGVCLVWSWFGWCVIGFVMVCNVLFVVKLVCHVVVMFCHGLCGVFGMVCLLLIASLIVGLVPAYRAYKNSLADGMSIRS